MRFEFATATRIVFGAGRLSEAPPAAAAWGTRVLLVTAGAADLAAPLRAALDARHVPVTLLAASGEPTVDSVAHGVQAARDAGCDMVIAIGGGSALDTGKAIALLVTNSGPPLDYLEVVGRGRPITQPSLPCITIPTTAGTGAEVTRNAVLGAPEHRVKVSLRSALMLPRLAIVDPELTYSLPPQVTASTGLDALTQLIEPYVSHAANPLTDALCREGLGRAGRSLRRVYASGRDVAGRTDMAIASLFGGLALANAKLGAVHGLAGPLGGMVPVPHGAACAALLPHVMAANVSALARRQGDHPALARYDEVARILTGDPRARAADGVRWVADLCRDLHVPALRTYGLVEADFPTLIDSALRASSMQGNPVPLTPPELLEILQRAW